jgi:hypothetical protein
VSQQVQGVIARSRNAPIERVAVEMDSGNVLCSVVVM